MSKQTLYFGAPPSFETIASVGVFINTKCFQSNVIKSRELIFTEPRILASPSFSNKALIHIIIQEAHLKQGDLQSRFRKLNMTMSEPVEVTPAQYEACFKYTLLAKLAPGWNVLGDFVVQGREFLTCNNKINAVKVHLQVNHKQTVVTLTPCMLTSPMISLKDLDISVGVIEQFKRNRYMDIDEGYIGTKWCHILPSNKKGQIVKIIHDMPRGENSGFSSYKELKRYWKNTYGYRLPETDENLFYCQVFFKMIGPKLFTYPNVCLRGSGNVSQNARGADVCEAFISDMRKFLKSVCGQKLHLSLTPWTPSVHTQSSLQFNPAKVKGCNAQPAAMSHCLPERPSVVTAPKLHYIKPTDTSVTLPTVSSVTVQDSGLELSCVINSRAPTLTSRVPTLTSQPERKGVLTKNAIPPFMKALITRKLAQKSIRPANHTPVSSQIPGHSQSTSTTDSGLESNVTIPSFPSKRPSITPEVTSKLLLKRRNDSPLSQTSIVMEGKHLNSILAASVSGNCGLYSKIILPVKKQREASSGPDSGARVTADVEALYFSGQIKKANTVSLSTWLNARGVKHKSRTKKVDLISLVDSLLRAES